MSPDSPPAERFDTLLRWAAERAGDDAPEPGRPEDRVAPWGKNATEDVPAYRDWWAARAESTEPAEPATRSQDGGRITVVVWLALTPLEELRPCVESIQRQSVLNFDAVLLGPANDRDGDTAAWLSALSLSDPRFRLIEQAAQGSDTAAGIPGDYVAFVDSRDQLHRDALARVAAVLGPDVDVVYSDEDELEPDGTHSRPVFKPDWAPDLLLSGPYLGSLLVVSRKVLETLEGDDADQRADVDFDLMLRATEVARRVVHIPEVLYHRRAGGPPTHRYNLADDDPVQRALQGALDRRDLDATVERDETTGSLRLRRPIRGAPTVAIVIPFRDQAPLLARCVESIPTGPGYDAYEIVLVDNGSVEPETRALLNRLEQDDAVTVVEYPGPFNWSAINNVGAAASSSEMLLFLNNDIEATGDGWLAALVEQGQRPEVGVVGARLFYPDGSLQHAGIVVGTGVIGWHIFMGLPPHRSAYLGWDRVVRPYSAVTGACLLTRRDVFDRLGGFDESLEVAFNDVDYCLRARDLGYEVLYAPDAELIHNEAVTRGLAGYRADGRRFLAKWERSRLRADPFFNPNLSRFAPWCPLRQPGEDQRWEAFVDDLAGGAG